MGIYAFMIGKRVGWRWTLFGWLGAVSLLVAMTAPSTRGQDSATPDTGQDATNSTPSDPQRWNLHFQSTAGAQGYPGFPAQYSGLNSLRPGGEVRDTISVDVTSGVRLWRGGEFFADLLIWQGYGLSKTEGLAGFPNGEAYRVGKTYPDAYLCRAYLRETIGFGGEKEAGDNELGGTKDVRRLTLTVGHLSATDIFDSNAYAGDARSQFMNWILITNGAWDYPADSLGYTNGAAAELNSRTWAGRLGIFQVSKVANGIRMDWNLAHAWSAVAEVERRYSPKGHAGALRLLAFDTRAHMGSYQETLNNPSLGENIVLTAAYRYKYGFGINLEQEIRKNLGAFARLGWSDGKNQTYEFTDVDRTATAGLSLKGTLWRRPHDIVGLVAAVNGISAVHRQYLAAGGLGVTVGDGALDYRSERLVEAYYNWRVAKHLQFTPDYQFAQNPAYNHVRGPVNIIALRLHTEF
ncbi:MAG TPA: carbohydrate porin [Terriglobia bacterium]|nr:carbohydrate porin [Terriglobia bacterium]